MLRTTFIVYIVLFVILIGVDAGHKHGRVLGFASTSFGKPVARQTTEKTRVATIDAAEVFDGSFFGDSNTNNVEEHNFMEEGAATSASFAIEIEKVSSSNVAWTAIGAIISLSAVLNTQVIGTSLRLLSVISSWYLSRLDVSPLLTKCITGGIIALLGDYGAQWFEYKRTNQRSKEEGVISSSDTAYSLRAGADDTARSTSGKSLSIHGMYDFRRGIARFLECLLISSPLMHYGYDLFERMVPTVAIGGGVGGIYRSLAALSHVIADSVFLDGIFVFTGIMATGLFEGHSLRKVLPNLRNVYVSTLKASIMTSSALMPLQFLSFRFLPLQLRVLSVNGVDLIWTAVVSHVSHSGDIESDR